MVLSISEQVATTNDYLLSLWKQRYRIDLSSVADSSNPRLLSQVIEFATKEGKALTARRVLNRLEIQCDPDGILENRLIDYLDDAIDRYEARQLTRALKSVYGVILDLYQQETLPPDFVDQANHERYPIYERVASCLAIPSLEVLEEALAPSLNTFRAVHQSAANPRMMGFLTTLFHFTNQYLLDSLTPAEHILIRPYCKFAEEQISLPWHQIRRAAARHQVGSPTLELVEKLIPYSHEITLEVSQQLQESYPSYFSRSGPLTCQEVQSSLTRDLEILQAYLYLCLLEGSVSPVTDRLLPLCLMVFPDIDVSWDLVEKTISILSRAIYSRTRPPELNQVKPILTSIKTLFFTENPHLMQNLQN